ncbi:MAG: cytochrome b [Proteobacteria bacterium]|nr:cytochrome b [Pseudomonadota bacterium]
MAERPAAYSGLQKLIHWVTALLVLTLIPVGFFMVTRGKATNFDAVTGQLYTAHKTFGFIVLLLVVLRIAVRLTRGTPAPEPTLSRFQVIASEAVHGLIYLALIAVPLLGWIGVSAYGARDLFGGFALPEIVAKNPGLAKAVLQYHGLIAIALAALLFAHIGAALMHRFVLKDGVMRRMLP